MPADGSPPLLEYHKEGTRWLWGCRRWVGGVSRLERIDPRNALSDDQ
jgi:hypothetical protein